MHVYKYHFKLPKTSGTTNKIDLKRDATINTNDKENDKQMQEYPLILGQKGNVSAKRTMCWPKGQCLNQY